MLIKMNEITEKKYYKYCIVPMCTNTSVTVPNKIFFRVPRNKQIRQKWCQIIRRDKKNYIPLSDKTSLFCCEDHFNIKEDTENYMEFYVLQGVVGSHKVSLRLKKHVQPHIFHCQGRTEGKAIGNVITKKRKLEDAMNTLTAIEAPGAASNALHASDQPAPVPPATTVATTSTTNHDFSMIQKDMTNYTQYKMGFSEKIRMADGVLPSKFHCQKYHRKSQYDKNRKEDRQNNTNPEIETEQRADTGVVIKIEEYDDEETLSASETFESSEDNDDEVVLKAIKVECPWQQSDKETLTDPVATASKYIQATQHVHVHFRSKGVQKKIETRDVSVSPIDMPTKTSYDYIQGRSKSIIYKMYIYLLQEYRHMKQTCQSKLDVTRLSNVKKRVAEATGLSQQDLRRILEEEKERVKYCTPRKRRRMYNRKKNCVHECVECEKGARAVHNDHNYNSTRSETEQNEAETTDSQDSADEVNVVIKDEDYIEYNEIEKHDTDEEDPLLTENMIKEEEEHKFGYYLIV